MRVLRKLACGAAVVGLATFGTLAVSSTAGATLAPQDCKTVSGTLDGRPDNGHGHGGAPADGNWAKVTGKRTITVCTADVSAPAAAKVQVDDADFHATVVDEGTLVTLGGDHLSPNNGVKLVANVHGSWKGGFSATFKAPRPNAKGDWPNWTPNTINGKTFKGTDGPKTGEWVSKLWTGAELKVDEGGWTAKYSWTYATCNEKWVDAYNNDDGKNDGPHGAGDITGMSKYAGECFQVSFLDKCDGVQVTLGNQAPTDATVITYFVNGVKHDVKGGAAMTVLTTNPDSHGYVVVKARGHKDWVHKYVKPVCASTSTGATPSASTPGTPSLPVTGFKTTVAVGVGVLALAAGAVAFVVGRRRRIHFEA
jgi:LPXTG-motif cell wall-anchored protein